MLIEIVVLIMFSNSAAFDLGGKVVQGDKGAIEDFPYSVFILMEKEYGSYICGSSILNQKIILTAAHCVEICNPRCRNGAAFVGSEHKRKGLKISITTALYHHQYNVKRVANDIGLALLARPIQLGKLAKRVAIYRSPRILEDAQIAGWGLIDEQQRLHTEFLHHVKQQVLTLSDCRAYIKNVPDGCLCAGGIKSEKYASEGDSGSALTIRGYIQIGLVSYKRPDVSKGLVVYTNVSYFYDWIKQTSKQLYCDHQ